MKVSEVEVERFMRKVTTIPDTGCWLWMGYLQPNLYGAFRCGGRRELSHRVSYAAFVGDLKAGMEIDHLCRHRWCVNPDHLEQVDHRTNMLRGDTIPARMAARTHCKNGHEFNEVNTRFTAGARVCRVCGREGLRAMRERRRAEACS